MAILPRATEAHTLFLGWPVKIKASRLVDQWSRSGAQEARRRYQERYHEATYTHMSYCTTLAQGPYDSQGPFTCSPAPTRMTFWFQGYDANKMPRRAKYASILNIDSSIHRLLEGSAAEAVACKSGRAFSLEKVQRCFKRFTPQRKRELLL